MRIVLSLIFALVTSSGQAVAPTENQAHTPLPSSWKLNLEASDFGDVPKPKSDVMTYMMGPGNVLKYLSTTVDALGHVYRVSWTGPQDGTMRQMVGSPFSQQGWINIQENAEHWEGGGLYFDCTRTLSDDQKRLTLACLVKVRDGRRFQQSLVYDRTR